MCHQCCPRPHGMHASRPWAGTSTPITRGIAASALLILKRRNSVARTRALLAQRHVASCQLACALALLGALCGQARGQALNLGMRSMQQESYLVDGWAVQAFSQSWATATPFGRAGPCLKAIRLTNIPLDISPAATGCSAFSGDCRISLIVTAPGECPARPGPYPVIFIYNGYKVQAKYYKSIADRLVSHGYVVIQYDRNGRTTPPSEVETTYTEQIITWARQANSTAQHPLFRLMNLSNLGVIGHSMGGSLAAISAADRAQLTKSVVLLDPVDYTHLSTRVARAFIQRYAKPIAVVTVGIHSKDRNGCKAPLDRAPTPKDKEGNGTCTPDWFVCDWDDGVPGIETKLVSQLTEPTDGPLGYIEFAAPGSLVVQEKQAGHITCCLDGRPDEFAVSCPWVVTSQDILPDTMTVVTGWMEHRLRGADLSSLEEWATSDAARQRLAYSIKTTGAPPPSS